jgi:glycerophosphoryl diester phosphodiesterase
MLPLPRHPLLRRILAACTFGLAGAACMLAAPAATDGVTAHRGDAGAFPENTLAAFASGIALGVDWIECDIFRTRDGHIVVIHDADTARVGDKALVVAESTYAELLGVDVAHAFRAANGLTLQACPPARIPLLEEVIQLVLGQTRTRLSIQPKQDIVDDAVAIIRRLGAEAHIGFNEGSFARVRRARELLPDAPIFYDTRGLHTAERITEALAHKFNALVLYAPNITAENVALVRAAGLEMGAWTVNDPAKMEALLRLGVQRIYTDYPARLIALKKAMQESP